jgi:hypothetical protein
MKHRPILLIGNSPNQLADSGRSWKGLMDSLCKVAGVNNQGNEDKPFTLHFEELLNHFRTSRLERLSAKSRQHISVWWDIDRLFKEKIAEKMKTLPVDDVHRALMRLPVDNILTTNYDYCLEKALEPKRPKRADWGTREIRYSYFLRRSVRHKFVFHIHGEIATPSTIMLGHESYVDSCSYIKSYAHRQGFMPKRMKPKPQVLHGLFRSGNCQIDLTKPHAWMDLFMLRDVHIVGFGLEFTEIDLWYLLAFKSRLRYDRAAPTDLKQSRIIYHYFADNSSRHRAKIALLRSLGVECECHPITIINDSRKDYRGAWKALLKHLARVLAVGRR